MKIDTKSLFSWIGGKRLLRKTIAPLVPKDIQSYIEPFGGAGWVLFYKDKWADLEIYNDLDGRLANLFRIVKYHPNGLKEELRYLLCSREMFMQFLKQEGITDIQKAARFLFVITRSFGSNCQTFSSRKKASGTNKSFGNIFLKIDAIHSRLDKVFVENKDFEEIINQYDNEEAFFYCDPPYTFGYGYKTASTKDFDHKRLSDCLKNIKGKFLLSYNDSENIRELYKDFEIIPIERLNGINNNLRKNKMFKELLIANYPITELYNA